jgi:hypothetical protein
VAGAPAYAKHFTGSDEKFFAHAKSGPNPNISACGLQAQKHTMQATQMSAHLDRAFAQPSATLNPKHRRAPLKVQAAISAPPKTALKTERSEQVCPWMVMVMVVVNPKAINEMNGIRSWASECKTA